MPCYFHEFASRAAGCGLAYLAEADFHAYMGMALPPELRARIDRLAAGPVEFEQYADFIVERAFRSSLLVHDSSAGAARIDPERLKGLHLTGNASLEKDSDGRAVFSAASGLSLKPGSDSAAAALAALVEAIPRSLSFGEASAEAQGRTGRPPDAGRLAEDLYACLQCGALTASTVPTPMPAVLPERPQGSPLARALAGSHESVPTLAHGSVRLDILPRLVLLYLNGQRDRRMLTDLLRADLPRRRLDLRLDELPVGKEEFARRLPLALDEALLALLRAGLICA
jgi:hypothetical protein